MVEKLKKGRLQRAEELGKGKRKRKNDAEEQRSQRLEDSQPLVHRATKIVNKNIGESTPQNLDQYPALQLKKS